MATSDSYDYSRTAGQLLTMAARNLGVLSAGASLSSDDQADMLEKLNVMTKQLQGTADGAVGIKIHTRQRITMFLVEGQRVYTIGPAVTDSRATTLYGSAISGADGSARAQRFVHLESAILRDSNYNDTELYVYRDAREYDRGVVDKFADGIPQAILVEPLRTNTRITLDCEPNDDTYTIVMTVLYPQEDYDSTSNDIAFPQEWLGFLEWELALRCAPMFGVKWTQEMQLNHANAKGMAFGLNPETSNLYFQCGEAG
jgi:hypothetical protein